MTKAIVLRWKLKPRHDVHVVAVPKGAGFFAAAVKDGDAEVSVWSVQEMGPMLSEERRLWVVGTGWEINIADGNELEHIGTAVDRDGFVWHVFEEVPQ